jgi:murein peptide amidase A
MRATVAHPQPSPLASAPRRAVRDALAPLDAIVAGSANLVANHTARFEVDGFTCELPRYLFIGPRGGGDPIRVGLFAGLYGDEPDGVYALIRFLTLLEEKPELATGYCLFVYPVCNPTGFEAHTRLTRRGKDLDREFWKHSPEPEVRLLESELVAHSLDGLISLHTDRESEGFYGFAHGTTLTQHLLEPALQAAEQLLTRNVNDQIQGFRAHGGIIRQSHPGRLSGPPGVRPRPFEIVLAAPVTPPSYLKDAAFVAALQSILSRYREFIAYAPNL